MQRSRGGAEQEQSRCRGLVGEASEIPRCRDGGAGVQKWRCFGAEVVQRWRRVSEDGAEVVQAGANVEV